MSLLSDDHVELQERDLDINRYQTMSIVQCSAVRCGAVQCGAVQCGAVRCGAVRCGAVQFSAVQCSAVWLLSDINRYKQMSSAVTMVIVLDLLDPKSS